MRRTLLLTLLYFGLIAGSRLFADVVTFNDGRQITGSVESGNTQELHVKVGDQSQTIDIHDVQIIQLGVSSSAPAPSKASATASEPAPDQPNTLFLNDGTHLAGRWWAIDATDVHFLVNNQLQHYPRTNVSGVTSGNAILPPPPARSTATPAAAPAPPPATPAQPTRTATLKRPSPAPPQASTPPVPTSQPAPAQQASTQQAPTLKRPTPAAAAAPSHGVSQPDEVGMVYFWNGRLLIPLERSPAVARKKGSTEYFEIQAPKSSVRVNETTTLVFVLRLPRGVDPASYSLFQLAAVDGNRQTRPRSDRQGAFMTWPVDIEINSESGLVTYNLSVRDLPAGEWSFSPSSSNDGYCFGVDPAAPDK